MNFSDVIKKRLEDALQRFDTIKTALEHDPMPSPAELADLGREQSELAPLVEAISSLKKAESEKADLADLLGDPDMKTVAIEEQERLSAHICELELEIQKLLVPKDTADDRGVIMEVRAGTGGDEAALFARDLWEMYTRFSEAHGWKAQVLSLSETDLRGVKEVIFSIEGKGVFAHLKFESGTHRVQRVPSTESSGRIHTSAATVAVLPQAEEVDIDIRDEDLRIDTYRASGAGGQHVNKTDSAIRITHLPSGLVVQQQDEKSQHKNKARAMKILRSRLYEMERAKEEEKRGSLRKLQVGTGDRSGRIRTYNFPQGRVTDHRINLTLHKIEAMMAGELTELITHLQTHEYTEKLQGL